MTKLYLFDEDGNLSFCKDVAITARNLKRVEEFSLDQVPTCAQSLFNTLLETVQEKTANSNCQFAMAE